MPKTFLLSQIKQRITPEKEMLIIQDEYAIIVEAKPPQRMKMIFKKAGPRYVQIDLEETVKFIVSKLAPKLNVKRFLKELILLHSTAEEIEELKERLQKTPKITQAPRCYALMIGGKKGRPYEFNIVG